MIKRMSIFYKNTSGISTGRPQSYRAWYTEGMKRMREWGGLRPFLMPLAGLSLMCVGLYVIQSIRNHDWQDWYLIWNLFLAWLPVLFAAGWSEAHRHFGWMNWRSVTLLGLWLIFLPNSFYIVTDFIHLPDPNHTHLLTTAVMFTGFAVTGLVLGLLALGMIHRELLRVLTTRMSSLVMAGVILLSSFAIYLGRDLRWNSWDVVVNPAGILFDVSDRFVNPMSHPQAAVVTIVFSALIGSLYLVSIGFAKAVRRLSR